MVNEPLLHNWFYGNHDVRVAAALIFALLFGSIPIGPVVRWLFADLPPVVRKIATSIVPLLNALKGFVPTVIAYHGGGEAVGLSAGLAAAIGHYYCPWRRFRGGKRIDVLAGIALALSPPAALVFVAFWLVAAAASSSVAMGTMFAAGLLFFPLWFFSGAQAALFGIAAGAAALLRNLSAGDEIFERL